MNKTIKYLILSAVFIGVIILAAAGYNYLSKKYMPDDGKPNTPESTKTLQTAPDFEVIDINGDTVHLKDYFGTPIVLNFWATWCGPCKAEMPYFDALYNEHKDDIIFMMVNLTDGYQDTVDKVNGFINENGYTFPVYYDTKYNAANTYGVSSIPMSIFINEKGEIADYHLGTMSEENLKKCIEEILN